MSFTIESQAVIYDSTVWVHGLTRRSGNAEACIQAIFDKDRYVPVSPYIYEEVDQAIARDVQNSREADKLRSRFAQIMSNPYISAPSHEEIEEVDLDEVRNNPTVQSDAESLGIHPEDIPILEAAQQCPNPEPTIFTTDEEFYSLSERKERYGIEYITFEYVECPEQ